MPIWLQIVIGVFGLAGTVLGIFGISAYINERMKHKASLKNKAEDEAAAKKLAEEEEKLAALEELKHQKYMRDLRAIIKEENEQSVAPLRAELTQIGNKLNLVADGTVDMLRERILSTYYKCLEKGYRTQYDSENIDHMHRDYSGLGGNSFIADCVKEIKSLPTEVEFKAKKKAAKKPKATKKVLLVEDKQ